MSCPQKKMKYDCVGVCMHVCVYVAIWELKRDEGHADWQSSTCWSRQRQTQRDSLRSSLSFLFILIRSPESQEVSLCTHLHNHHRETMPSRENTVTPESGAAFYVYLFAFILLLMFKWEMLVAWHLVSWSVPLLQAYIYFNNLQSISTDRQIQF